VDSCEDGNETDVSYTVKTALIADQLLASQEWLFIWVSLDVLFRRSSPMLSSIGRDVEVCGQVQFLETYETRLADIDG
jgi:hypothetical protein